MAKDAKGHGSAGKGGAGSAKKYDFGFNSASSKQAKAQDAFGPRGSRQAAAAMHDANKAQKAAARARVAAKMASKGKR
jgi:hypothetical protein